MIQEQDNSATASPAPVVREVRCKSVLGDSGICDYAVNCYTGCVHGCTYCYARFMGRFHHPGQAWGSFVDATVNAPETLERQCAQRRLDSPGSVFLSSVCDPYQPAEAEYQLTRRCLKILLDAGFNIHVQTKSNLVCRDLDLMKGRSNVSLCLTVTTLDEALARATEPLAAAPRDRLEALRQAAAVGVPIKAFVGPLLPGLSDTPESLGAVFAALAELPLRQVFVDRLNLRWGVWPAMQGTLQRLRPESAPLTREILFSPARAARYEAELRQRVDSAAREARLTAPLKTVF